jgi:hypothetical protein
MSETIVAGRAEQTSYSPCHMVVVDSQKLSVRRPFANRADAFLPLQQTFVLFDRHVEVPEQTPSSFPLSKMLKLAGSKLSMVLSDFCSALRSSSGNSFAMSFQPTRVTVSGPSSTATTLLTIELGEELGLSAPRAALGSSLNVNCSPFENHVLILQEMN